jgi:hypothetical protein
MRERQLARVLARLQRFFNDQDPTAVLDPEAVAEVEALVATVPDPTADVEIAYAAGWLHWARYLVLDVGDDQQDLAAALALFASVYQSDPDAVPDQVRALFDENRSVSPDTPEAQAAHAVTLLGEVLRTGDRAALNAAIDLLRQALAATPTDHPDRAGYLSNLGGALQTRFERTGAQTDLDAAIDAGRAAVAATPTDHPDRAGYLSNLGGALRIRFERTGAQADLDAAVDAGRAAVAVEVASPRVRAGAARGWGRAAGAAGRWGDAVAGFEAAASLLGRLAPRSLARADQEHLLAEMGGLAADAAACCVHAGLTGRAVELFEQGRGVLLGQALDTRTDVTALAEVHPALAGQFTALCEELDRVDEPAVSVTLGAPPAGSPLVDPAAAARAQARRHAAVVEFDRLAGEIRTLPGFEGFLRPPPLAQLRAAAADGPVVVVAVSSFGSHALLLTGAGVDVVPLDGLTPEAVYDRVVAFLDALASEGSPATRAAAQRRLEGILGWLWDTLAGPVLDRLGIDGPPETGQQWPRVWWCVTGLLSFLPVHAAGHHHTRFDPAPATLIDRVISSYTPTIRALTHARRASPAEPAGDGRPAGLDGARVAAVAMPHTHGAGDLPGARAETDGLQRRFPGRVGVLTGAEATREAVLAVLPNARWAHFACHGTAEIANPSNSRLLLHDRPLTVVDVARLRLDRAELAYLSACETARPGGRLADEAIHLASAFQLAGYQHVIATLWPIDDDNAVALADAIYTTLATTADVAGAVHTATRALRGSWPRHPTVWASHIHAGA